MSDTTFVVMYHPALGNVQVDAPLQAVSTYASHGWLLLDPAATAPPIASPYLSQPAADSRYLRDWAGAEVLTAGAVRVAPDGHVIVRTADGTTRSTYDTTEQALWTALGGANDPALRAAYVPKWKANTAYLAATDFVLNPSGQIVQPKVDFTSGSSYSAANWNVVSSGVTALTPTATKTATYTAAVGELAMMNVAGGGAILTLPTAPADKAQVGFRSIGATTTVPLVINRGGSTDTIGTTGATSASIPLDSETGVFQYDAPNSRWLLIEGFKPLSALDGRYASLAGTNIFTGQFSVGPNPAGQSGFGLQTLAKSDTFPWPSAPAQSMFELYHDGTVGNIFHLTSGPDISPTNAPALIALGVDSNRTGLYVHMRGDYGGGTGINIAVDQANTAGHYGMVVNGGKGGAPATWWQQNNDAGSSNAQPLAVFFAFQSFSAAQRMVEFRCPGTGVDGTTFSGTLAGYVRSQDGALIWQSVASFQPSAVNVTPLLTVGLSGQTADLQQWNVSGTGTVAKVDKSGNIFGNTVLATAAGTFIGLYDTGGTANSRRFQLAQSSGSLLITARNDDGTNKGTVFQVDQSGNQTVKDGSNFLLGTTTGTKIGTATTQKLGFFNATPVVQPAATPAAATDLATVITLANDLRSKLLSLGLAA